MIYRMPGRPWFASIKKGFPARPLSWEGWVFTGFYVAGLASFAHVTRVLSPYQQPPLVAPFVVAAAMLTGVFLIFSWLKSELPVDASAGPRAKVEIMQSKDDKDPPPTRWI